MDTYETGYSDVINKGNSPKRLVRAGATQLQRRPCVAVDTMILTWDLRCSMAAYRSYGGSMQDWAKEDDEMKGARYDEATMRTNQRVPLLSQAPADAEGELGSRFPVPATLRAHADKLSRRAHVFSVCPPLPFIFCVVFLYPLSFKNGFGC